MKNKSIKKRTLAVLMAFTMFITYAPPLSYALTEETEKSNDVTVETSEEPAVPESEIEDPETIDSLLLGLEPSENETVLHENKASERKALKSKTAPAVNKNTNNIKVEDVRCFGQDRFETARNVATEYKRITDSEFENVIVANGLNYPDALSGGYLAKVMHAPILLVSSAVENDIVDYISNNIASDGKVYILGGTGVVSPAFANKIRAKGIEPIRLGGKDRYETNLEILRKAKEFEDEETETLICSTAGYADSLSASAVGKPILLVGSTLTEGQKEYIGSLSKKEFYLIGGTGVVTEKVEAELGDLGTVLDRIWGMTRFETSAEVARKFFQTTDNVMLTYAYNFPDGLSGGPLAMQEKAPIILADPNNTEDARAYVESSDGFRSITLGGPKLITPDAVWIIMGRKAPYITAEKKYVKIQVGETAGIRIDSNWGTKVDESSRNTDVIEVSKVTEYSEGLPIEQYTVKGEKVGTALLILADDKENSGLVTEPVTVVVTDGEASVKTLYGIIDTTGYEDENGYQAVELERKINGKRVFCENHSDSGYVRLAYEVENGETKTLTFLDIPLETDDIYKVEIRKEEKTAEGSFENKGTYKIDINPSQYTSGMELTIKEPAIHYQDDIDFVTLTFEESMAAWNSALDKNYKMIMKDLGFTSY